MDAISSYSPPPAFTPPETEDGGLDFAGLLRFVVRRRMVILATTLIAGGAIFLSQALQPTTYQASALVMITPPRDRVSPSENPDQSQAVDSGFIDSQIEIMRSRRVIGEVVDRLKLAAPPPESAGPSSLFGGLFGFAPGLNAPAPKAKTDPASLRQNAVEALAGDLSTRRRGLTYVIELAAVGASPQEAAALANAWVSSYLDTQLQARLDAAQNANSFLSEKLNQLKSEVQEKDAAVEAYRARYGLLTAEGVSLTEQQASDLQGSLLKARSDLAQKEAQLQQVKSILANGGSLESVAAVINSETIRDLRAKQADLEQQEADMENRYGDLHPALQKVRQQEQGMRTQIDAEVQRIIANQQNEVDIARTWLNTLQGNAHAVQGALVSNNANAVQLRELERDATATRTIYESFLARYNEISGQESFKGTDARLVAAAAAPNRPAGPRIKFGAFVGLVGGLFLGLLAALLVEVLDGSIHRADDLGRRLRRFVLASLPVVRKTELKRANADSPPALIVEKPMSAFAESLRSLRTSLLYSSASRTIRVVAITSALPGEGKTTISMCLARTASAAGQNVLLIDCDLRRRAVSEVARLAPEQGLIQVLAGEIDWRKGVHIDPRSQCHILPVAQATFSPKDMFGSEAMQTLLAEARNTYDLVLLDCPPVLGVADARVLARLADETILVTKWGRTSVRVARAALERLEESGVDVLGVVVNSAVPSRLEYSELAAYSGKYSKYYA